MTEQGDESRVQKGSGGDQLTLRVVNQAGEETFFKIKLDTPLGKLMGAYCTRRGDPPNTTRFLYDGERVKDTDTPGSLHMQDGDVLDAVAQQTGGLFH
jgi:small ubiquitin-related modifier